MAFNSADTAAFKNVWVFCEQRQGVMMPTTFELISEGRKLADELGVQLSGILLGDNVDGIAAELGEYGADKVYVYNSPLLKDFTTDAYTKVIVEAVEELKPEVLLFGASNIGRDLAPRCAARLHTGLCADCTHLDIDMPNYKGFLKEASTLPEERIEKLGTVKIAGQDHDVSRDLKMTRPAFGGHLMASIICPRFRPAMATVRPGVMKKRECKKNVEILHPAFALEAADIHTEVVDTVKAAKKLVDLIGADFIVSVGRGISKDVEGGIKLAEELAEVLGGVVGSSRACVDAGAAAVMPLGSPIGTNRGLRTREMIGILIEEIDLPIVVDAGIGLPSHACEAMEMGAAACLVNTGIASSTDPVLMGRAFRQAVEAGRAAWLAGPGAVRASGEGAQASSPLTGFLR